jgi:glycosyltransferase involved in cell wall biosynthesis
VSTLKVGYYYRTGRAGAQGGGLGPYTRRTLEVLLGSDIPCDFNLLIAPEQIPEAKALAERFSDRPFDVTVLRGRASIDFMLRSVDLLRTKFTWSWLDRSAPYLNYLEYQARPGPLDVVHCPGQSLPLYTWRADVIVTPHDVQHLHLPENFSARERMSRGQTGFLSLKHASRVVVSYEHVKEDIIRFFGVPAKHIFVCPHPVVREWLPTADARAIGTVRQGYGLPSRFLFYPAQTWPHKNHLALLRALARLRDERGVEPPHLVCTGTLNEHHKLLVAETEKLQLGRFVHFLGLVSEDDLAGLYAACTLVVIPSLYEAGSYPLMEALAAGVPVICSRTTSLPETLSNDAFTFDGRDVDQLAALIERLWSSPLALTACAEHSAQRGNELVAAGLGPTQAAFARLYDSLR